MASRRHTVAAGLLIGPVVLAVGWFWGDRLANCLRALWAMYGSPGAIRASVAGFDAWAPLVFIGLQALQVVLSPIPGEATGVLGGYLFGTWLGLVYSTSPWRPHSPCSPGSIAAGSCNGSGGCRGLLCRIFPPPPSERSRMAAMRLRETP